MRASKIRAQRDRERAKKEAEQEQARLDRKAEELRNRKGGFALVLKGEKIPLKSKQRTSAIMPYPKVLRDTDTSHLVIRSLAVDPVAVIKEQPRLSEEMQKRELQAQREIREKKKLAMPLYNKGGLQYPTQEEILAMKNGELRRRS